MAADLDRVLEAFRAADAAGEGAISREGLGQVIRQIDPGSWDDKQLDLLFDATDTNEDGRIQFEEFLAWLNSNGDGHGLDCSHEAGGATDPTAVGSMNVPADVRPATAPTLTFVQPGSASGPGQLFTWGRGSDGQLGQDLVAHPPSNCALPHPVPELVSVVQVACGGGQQGATAAVTAAGELFTFGNNYKARLGHGEGPALRKPRRVEAFAGQVVTAAAMGAEHGLACTQQGHVFSWGNNHDGELGLGFNGAVVPTPSQVELPAPAAVIDCEDGYSGSVLIDGRLFLWGKNEHGRLGSGDKLPRTRPAEVALSGHVASLSLGSLYAGAVEQGGGLWMWGYGGHGNLGLGSRKSHSSPRRVGLPEAAAQLACTRGQDGCKGGLNPKQGGNEGPHTVVVGASGALYTFGTCHKGLLMNLGSKDGGFGKPWDELLPFRVGSAVRNGTENPPMSSLAVWPPPYDKIGPAVSAVSGHIHAACVCADGRAWAWGCGSNDGRCGVERFLNMKGDGKPPTVDSMKCYLMGPHPIGIARVPYWTHGPSLKGRKVLAVATGRNHMAGIAAEGGE